MSFYLYLAILTPLILSAVIALASPVLKEKSGWVALLSAIISVGSILMVAFKMELPGSVVVSTEWIPSLGINFSFLADGISLFFGLIVSVIGVLVIFYAIHYLDRGTRHARFYSSLLLFMAAMLGTVFSNNLILLFCFWELTGLASFLLIGFEFQDSSSRIGARQALLVTSSTGLLLLVGFIMVAQVSGSMEISELLTSGLPLEEHKGWLTAAMCLVVLGAFGKSAQFPFHFWLPNAMAAPTPVSAYLHSATMVKLGVFLCARVFPFFMELELWPQLLAIVAFGTMVIAAIFALLSHDLKAILAYSTISQLGFLIGYYGLGPVTGVEYDYLHILNHVFFKGSLFMVVGIVAHATGERDIRKLGGLMKRMPLVGITCLVAAATMAGFPGTTGFLSKEMMLKEIFDAMGSHGLLGLYATICVIVMSVVKVAFSARIFMNIFMGKEPDEIGHHYHAPSFALQVPPLILAACAFIGGVLPIIMEKAFALLTVPGINIAPGHLVIWHGFTPELVISTSMVIVGLVLYWVGQKTNWRWADIPKTFRFDFAFEYGLVAFSKATKLITSGLSSDRPMNYLPMIFAFLIGLFAFFFAQHFSSLDFLRVVEWKIDYLRAFVAALIALAVLGALILKRWTTQLISLSIAGFLTCFYFVLYQAPDLALTQILVEAVTLIMILLLLGRFPKSAERGEVSKRCTRTRQTFNTVAAVSMGVLMTLFVLMITVDPHPDPIGNKFLQQTVPLAEGSNAVNTVLVDFRGFDTMGEIAVLVIAMLGCLGLLLRYKRTEEEYKAGPMGPPGFGIDHREEGE
ncbi:MAG: DUF4040 domain-containing protein [Verrucomicrobia bacterium]|nr:DUF4040 domain-containing protein [Verrucomicrobiota bacterium]